ncbi:MAG: hypothetical protein R6V26_10275 [Roseovarius sp.]
MYANRMISMVIRMIMRRVMRHGMKTSMGGLGKGGGEDVDRPGPEGEKTAQRARRTMRAGRKIGRF